MRGTLVVAALSGAIAILVTIVIVGDTSGDGSPPAAPEAVPTATPIGAPDASNTPTPAETTTATPSATVTPEPSPEPTADASPERTEAARYRDAISARDGGDLDTAVAELSVIAEGRGVLAPFARFRLASSRRPPATTRRRSRRSNGRWPTPRARAPFVRSGAVRAPPRRRRRSP